MKKIFATCAVVALSGCSTITTGLTQPFTVDTPQALAASCVLKDTRGGQWTVDETPGTVEVRKGDGPMTVTCSKVGYKSAAVVVKEGLAGMTFGNVLLGGGIGIVVDAASGAAQEYPDVTTVWLEPEVWASEEARVQWNADKAAFEAAQLEKKNPQSQQEDNK